MLAELRLELDPGLEAPRALGPLIDPAFHSCGTVPPHGHRDLAHPEPGLYVVGIKSYGRAPTFLITTGNEQVRSVVAGLEVPAAAHRLPPVGVPAQGFITGIAGGGRVAELALTDVTAPTTAGGCGTGGCCAG